MKTNTIATLALGTASVLMFSSCGDDKSTDTNSSGGSDELGVGTVDGVALKIDLPKEIIEGSPAPKNIPNLMPRAKKFPEFKVPKGTVNLAKGKKVTSSDEYPIMGEVSLITDGEKEGGEGYFLELIEGPQWVQIDLEKSSPIYAIIVWHFHAKKVAYHDVIIQVSDDPEFKTGVTTLYNNDYDNSLKMGKGNNRPYVESYIGKVIDGKGTKGRYVRLYSNGNTASGLNHYIEVEVHGTPE